MQIQIKPINMAGYMDKDYPEWVVYQAGQYAKPEMILSDLNLEQIVKEYCRFHGITLDNLK